MSAFSRTRPFRPAYQVIATEKSQTVTERRILMRGWAAREGRSRIGFGEMAGAVIRGAQWTARRRSPPSLPCSRAYSAGMYEGESISSPVRSLGIMPPCHHRRCQAGDRRMMANRAQIRIETLLERVDQ